MSCTNLTCKNVSVFTFWVLSDWRLSIIMIKHIYVHFFSRPQILFNFVHVLRQGWLPLFDASKSLFPSPLLFSCLSQHLLTHKYFMYFFLIQSFSISIYFNIFTILHYLLYVLFIPLLFLILSLSYQTAWLTNQFSFIDQCYDYFIY